MIADQRDYRQAQQALQELGEWLHRLELETSTLDKSLNQAAVRRRIAQLQQDLADYDSRAYLNGADATAATSAEHRLQEH